MYEGKKEKKEKQFKANSNKAVGTKDTRANTIKKSEGSDIQITH